jgi:hypothetical protein
MNNSWAITSSRYAWRSNACNSSNFSLGKSSPPIDVLIARHPTNRGFLRSSTSPNTVEDPLQNAHVLAEPRPDELAVGILSEPVHVENPRRLTEVPLHVDPVAEVVAHVVATERQHRHRVTSHFPDTPCGGERNIWIPSRRCRSSDGLSGVRGSSDGTIQHSPSARTGRGFENKRTP